MKPALALVLAVAGALAALPQAAPRAATPVPSADNPRLQTVTWSPDEDTVLTALPMTGLTVLFQPGEQIARVSLSDSRAFDARVSAERDALLLVPQQEPAKALILVHTDLRDYRLQVETGTGLMAAYLVRFTFDKPRTAELAPVPAPPPSGETWGYRLRGDRSVQPAEISDDGEQTRIVFAPEQDLPAVFAIGPTGEEQAINGYMRGGVFVIDRVWNELVFRMDKDKATAQRNRSPEQKGG